MESVERKKLDAALQKHLQSQIADQVCQLLNIIEQELWRNGIRPAKSSFTEHANRVMSMLKNSENVVLETLGQLRISRRPTISTTPRESEDFAISYLDFFIKKDRQEIWIYMGQMDKFSATRMSRNEKFLMQVIQVIIENMENSAFAVSAMARQLNVSRTQLLRKVLALTGVAPSDLIRIIRLWQAAEMIRFDSDIITQIAYAVGFSDQSYFTKRFKRKFGMSPTEYAKTCGNVILSAHTAGSLSLRSAS